MEPTPTSGTSIDGASMAPNDTTPGSQAIRSGKYEIPTPRRGQSSGPYASPNLVSKEPAMKAPECEFDEYGAELDPEARVWNTYVKEANRFDTEKASAWNKSLDILIIFAALFSTISAAFVVESSKKLQDDPAERSARALEAILETLRVLANNSQSLDLPAPVRKEFSPTWPDLLVNILWFLGLCLSVAASLIAILAKEWCLMFMSGRNGHPCPQARRRQQRWDALQQWKMPEVLMLLPSLVHMSLLIFAIGLCIHLWYIHRGVAIPVVLVTFGALTLFIASTVLPLLYHSCPYRSAASSFVMAFHNILVMNTGGDENFIPEQDMTTSKALAWLIQNCEHPRSVDTALQAIAGADKGLPLDPLRQCDAHTIVCRRVAAGSSYPKNYDVVFSLYARALSVLQPPTGKQEDEEPYNDVNELKRKIRNLRMVTERAVASLLATKKLPSTHSNLQALKIGNTAASHCLQSPGYESPGQACDALAQAVELLEKYGHDWDLLHPAALRSLLIGAAILLSCSSVHSDPSMVVPYALRLLHVDLHRGVCGILLAAFTTSQNDYLGWTHPAPLTPTAKAERAIEVVAHYASMLDELSISEAKFLDNFGSLELLFNSRKYLLKDRDLCRIYQKISSTNRDSYTVHTFPQSFDLRQYVMDSITKRLSNSNGRDDIWASKESIEAHLQALRCTYDESIGAPTSEVYVFVIESICRIPSTQVQQAGGEVMDQFPWPQISDNLTAIASQNIISTLADALRSDEGYVKLFAMAQICLFIHLVLQVPHDRDSGWGFLTSLLQREEPCHPLQGQGFVPELQSLQESLVQKLSHMCNKNYCYSSQHIESYSRRVLQRMRSEE